jgi:hypothetical protein
VLRPGIVLALKEMAFLHVVGSPHNSLIVADCDSCYERFSDISVPFFAMSVT